MHRQELNRGDDSRALLLRLRRLGQVRAPATILPGVLDRVGPADRYAPIESAIGPVFVAFNDEGISAILPAVDAAEFERAFRARFGRPVRPAPELPARILRGVEDGLRAGGTLADGSRTAARRRRALPFDLRGLTDFERAVLLKTVEIPRGEVRTYGWVAREIGRPRAGRAVGSALRRNPIPLLIPCHRVVRGDSRVGEYALGPDAKRAMLAAEGVEPDDLEALGRAGVRYYGSDTTRIFCFPTCRHGRRVTERHRVEFSSAGAAAAAGYRPCKVCRPALAAG